MEELLPKAIALVVTGLVLVGVLWAARPRPLFAVRVLNTEPETVSGHVTGAFLARVREVAAEHRIRLGFVFGVAAANGRIRLKMSGHFPASAQQQLRNWWAEFGWPAPRPKRRP